MLYEYLIENKFVKADHCVYIKETENESDYSNMGQ